MTLYDLYGSKKLKNLYFYKIQKLKILWKNLTIQSI